MAGFKTHITTSTLLGVAYGTTAAAAFEAPIPACILAGGLCSVSGMLPDLDSDSGVPLRESIAFAAAVVPMLMIDRFEHMKLSPETMVLTGGIIYALIRFGLASVLKRYTVHRGMFHSLPAALIAGEAAFLICAHENLWLRYFNAGAVLLGFMSHLVLDEIWSMEIKRGRFHLKKSFGTALKFWGDSTLPNLATYANVIILSYLVFQDPVWMNSKTPPEENLKHMAERAVEKTWH